MPLPSDGYSRGRLGAPTALVVDETVPRYAESIFPDLSGLDQLGSQNKEPNRLVKQALGMERFRVPRSVTDAMGRTDGFEA